MAVHYGKSKQEMEYMVSEVCILKNFYSWSLEKKGFTVFALLIFLRCDYKENILPQKSTISHRYRDRLW